MKIFRIILTPIITLLITACASVQTYEGKNLSPEQVAHIKSSQWDHLLDSTVIQEVDGKALGFGVVKATVLPGEHRIKFRVNSSAGLVTFSAYVTLSMHAEAGHTYKLDGKIYGGEHLFAWITDETTNKIVAGKKYGADASSYAYSADKDTSLTKLGEYNHDKRISIHQELDALSRKLWKSSVREILNSSPTSTIQGKSVIELIDLDNDKSPEQFAYRGKESSGDDTMDFGFIYDLNNDAKIDYIVFYQGTGISEDGADSFGFTITFYHWIDTNYDGNIDTWVYPDVDLNNNGKIDMDVYAWLHDADGDGVVESGEYLGASMKQSIDIEEGVVDIKRLGHESMESVNKNLSQIQELSNKVLADINNLI